jgi:hypothetical protein
MCSVDVLLGLSRAIVGAVLHVKRLTATTIHAATLE